MQLLKNLRLQYKLILLILPLSFEVLLLVYLLVSDQQKAIQFVSKETVGVRLAGRLVRAYSECLSNTSRTRLAESIALGMPEAEALNMLPQSQELIQRLRAGASCEEIVPVIASVQQNSNLILDSDLTCYYLMEIALMRVPKYLRVVQVDQSNKDAENRTVQNALISDVIGYTGRSLDGALRANHGEVGALEADYARLRKASQQFMGAKVRGLPAEATAAATALFESSISTLSRLLDERVDNLRFQRNRDIGLAIVLFLGSLILIHLISSDIVRALNRLFDATDEISEGRFGKHAGESRKDEIGRLGVMFEKMSLSLAERQEQINQHKLFLESEVEKRTAELRTANSELEAFNYSVSHDLRAPVRWISGFSESLELDYAPVLGEGGLRLLSRIQESSRRMAEIIEALLRLSKLSQSSVRRTQLDISALVESVFYNLNQNDPGRKVILRVQSGIFEEGDAALVRILLENLMGNAWKYTMEEADAIIEFSSVQSDQGLICCVRDNGVGFSVENANRLFQPFQRFHDGTVYPGMGIGLATSRRIVQMHGGRLWAESSPGAGSKFYFLLKVNAPAG